VKALDVRASGRVEQLPFGTALFREELPNVRSRNFIWVDSPAAVLDVAEVARTAERLQAGAGLPHRRLVFEDEATADAATALLVPRGWRVERQVVMVHDGSLPPEPDGPEVREVDATALLPAREVLLRAYTEIRGEDSIQQLLAADAAITSATTERCFAGVENEAIVSFCHLFSDGDTAQIEDVETVPAYRRGGFARAVLLRALAEAAATHDFIFLLALDEDWPKQWYTRTGFIEAGYLWELGLVPEEEGGGPGDPE
jgi:GNAT superfamily N-acetyltransferase